MNKLTDNIESTGSQAGQRRAITDLACPATPLQLGMLYHALSEAGAGVDIEQISFDLKEPLRVEDFIRTWQVVLDRHSILRAHFEWRGVAEPHLVLPEHANMPVEVLDWSHQGPDQQAEAFEALQLEDRDQDFAMDVSPLMRMRIVVRGPQYFSVLWTFHHALLDGRSFPLVLQEVFERYDTGKSVPGGPARTFEAYAHHVGDLPLADHEVFWKTRMQGLEGPSVLRQPDDEDNERRGADALELKLTSEQTRQLNYLATESGVTLNTVVQSAWALVVAHWCQKDDIVFGVTRACRHSMAGLEEAIGLFINTVPMRVRLTRQLGLQDLLGQVRAEQIAMRAYETTPLNLIQRWSPVGADSPLFNSMVMFDSASLDLRMKQILGPDSGRAFQYTGQTNYPLTLLAYGEFELQLRLEYARGRFSAETAARLIGQMHRLLQTFIERPTVPALALPYLSAGEQALLEQWNQTEASYDLSTTLAQLFERQVARTPDAVALVFNEQTLSYRQFNERVNQLAHRLIAQGVGADSLVGVYAERSVEMLVAIHAAVKAGGAYVPLDPEHPAERLGFMLDDTEAVVVLTQRALVERLPAGTRYLVLDDAAEGLANEPVHNPELTRASDQLAYVLYTSGSTGRPKGVMNEHRGIVNRLAWMQEAFKLTAEDVVLQKTPTSFDVSVWELFWPLLVGAKLVVAEPGDHRNTQTLARLIQDHQVTTLHFVPSMLRLFLEEPAIGGCASVRRVICSGEALPRDLQDRFFERLAHAELHNLYGPTEAAIDVSWWPCDRASSLAVVPIGRAIANTSLHVLDPGLQPVPPGVPGELHIGGVQVARGYLKRPELTAEKFVADPFASQPGARLYKTGDLARFLPDGNLDYLGRLDFQVKIRGFRIELGEIESVLMEQPSVREAVVLAREDRADDRRLVAYVVAESDIPCDSVELKQALSTRLAAYMVPSAFVVLQRLPLSSNGKVDRKALPAPEAPDQSDAVAPRHATEQTIAAVWCEVLGIDSVGVTQTFFDAGGDSLLLLKLANSLSAALNRDVAISDLLRLTTIERQAALGAEMALGGDERLDAAGQMASQQRKALARRRQRSQGKHA